MSGKAQILRQGNAQVRGSQQSGFGLIELMIASVVFLVGIAAVAQLVPAALQYNLQNRVDTTSVVIAQRELDQMLAQPLTNTTFTDADGNSCSLGTISASANTATTAGSPLTRFGSFVKIDFSQSKVNGYNFQFTNPQNPTDGTYDVRWAVITQTNGTAHVVSKRFIVGAQRTSGTQILPSVSLDAWQQWVQ